MSTQGKYSTTRTAREIADREAKLEHTLSLAGYVFQPGYVGGRGVARKAYKRSPDLVLPDIKPRPHPRPLVFHPPMITDRARLIQAARIFVCSILRNTGTGDG